MSTQPKAAESTEHEDYVRFGRYAKILEKMDGDEFDAIVAGELEPQMFLERHGLQGVDR